MHILALDLATRCGWARGEVGARPRCGAFNLAPSGGDDEAAISGLARALRATERPDLLAVEHYIDPRASVQLSKRKTKHPNPDAARFISVRGMLLYAVARAQAAIWECEFLAPYPATVRKFFIGRANWGSTLRTKRAVIAQCHFVDWMPPDDFSSDKADALALFAYVERKHLDLFRKGNDHAEPHRGTC